MGRLPRATTTGGKLASLLKRDFKMCILPKLLGKWFTRLQFSPVQPDHFRWEEQKKAIWLRKTNEEYSLAESRPCSLMRYSGSKWWWMAERRLAATNGHALHSGTIWSVPICLMYHVAHAWLCSSCQWKTCIIIIVITYCSIPYCILTMCNRVTCECKVIHVHACAYIILYPWKCKWYHYYCIVHKLVSCNVCMLAHLISFARLQFNSVQVMCKQCIYIYTYILYIFI